LSDQSARHGFHKHTLNQADCYCYYHLVRVCSQFNKFFLLIKRSHSDSLFTSWHCTTSVP